MPMIRKVAVVACLVAQVAAGAAVASADDTEATGIPEESILAGRADPVRSAFAARGITYGLDYTGEYYNVLDGGLSQGSTFNGLFNLYTDVDLSKLVGWPGATFHINAFYIHGEGPSTRKIGNIFAVTNIEALDGVRLNEIWIEQALFDDKIKVRLGSLAADTEFFVSDTAGQFLNGTFGWPGITAANQTQGGPGYPLASMGARIQFQPTDDVTLLAGFFNASPADPNADDPQLDNRRGTDFRFGDGLLMMLEGQFNYDFGLPGVVKLGGWRQFNDDFANFVTDEVVDGSSGAYAIIDQQIWKGASDGQGVSVFGRISRSPDRQNLIDFYYDAGVVFSGLVPQRPDDAFGVAFVLAISRTGLLSARSLMAPP